MLRRAEPSLGDSLPRKAAKSKHLYILLPKAQSGVEGHNIVTSLKVVGGSHWLQQAHTTIEDGQCHPGTVDSHICWSHLKLHALEDEVEEEAHVDSTVKTIWLAWSDSRITWEQTPHVWEGYSTI